MPYADVIQQKEAQHRSYLRNKEKVRETTRRRRREIVAWLTEYKVSRGCSRCPENHVATIDYHHENGEKDQCLAYASRLQWSQERLEREVAKCIVLCSNCHRKLHWNERNNISE